MSVHAPSIKAISRSATSKGIGAFLVLSAFPWWLWYQRLKKLPHPPRKRQILQSDQVGCGIWVITSSKTSEGPDPDIWRSTCANRNSLEAPRSYCHQQFYYLFCLLVVRSGPCFLLVLYPFSSSSAFVQEWDDGRIATKLRKLLRAGFCSQGWKKTYLENENRFGFCEMY